jgi:hypothetical protein
LRIAAFISIILFFALVGRSSAAPPASLGTTPAAGAAGGSFAGRIELSASKAGVSKVDPATLRVVATRTDAGAAVGVVSIGPEMKNRDGAPFVDVHITQLPLGAPIAISVEVVLPSGASPLPTGFVNLVRFRPKDGGFGDDVFSVTLDAAHAANPGIVDFVPYVIEVPPLPSQTSPSPR